MQASHDIARNKLGYWEVRYSEKQDNGRWRSRRVSTGTKDRGEAERFAEDFVNSTARLSQVGPKPTVAEILEAYVSERPNQDFVTRVVKRQLGHLPCDLLTSKVAADYRKQRLGAGLSSGTVRRELSALSSALTWAARTKMSGGAVRLDEVAYIEKPPESTPRSAWLNEEQEPEFHALAMGLSMGRRELHRLTLFVGIGLDTAARKEAILDLTWDRVDLSVGRLDFRVPGKSTGNKRRTVVEISARLRPLLERAHREWKARGGAGGEPVVGAGDVRKTWDRWVEGLAGYEWMTAHLMRHSWAKLHARAGVLLFDIATVLGDTYETVARNYLHDCPGNSGVVNRRF
jgi:integrase